MSPGKKIALALCVVALATAALAYFGAASSWQYYLTTDDCLSQRQSLGTARLRVSGRVAAGSLQRAADSGPSRFALEGAAENLPVVASQPLPDNLAEGKEVLVEGKLDEAGALRASKVLTRCATKYQASHPPDIVVAGREPDRRSR